MGWKFASEVVGLWVSHNATVLSIAQVANIPGMFLCCVLTNHNNIMRMDVQVHECVVCACVAKRR
jgi:hypothetical protein